MNKLVNEFLIGFSKIEPIHNVNLKIKFEGSEGSIDSTIDKNVQRYMIALLELTPLDSNLIKEVTDLITNQLTVLVKFKNNSEAFFEASQKTQLGEAIWKELEKKL